MLISIAYDYLVIKYFHMSCKVDNKFFIAGLYELLHT